tara:strand:- start:367 stop:555 length:189 start_codon:yes stop_codon:yes gene_type:complete
MMQLAEITGNRKMQFRMILNYEGRGKLQASSSKPEKRFDIQDYPGISKITHLLQVQRRMGGN